MRAGGFPGNPGGLVVSIVKTAGGRAPAHHARGRGRSTWLSDGAKPASWTRGYATARSHLSRSRMRQNPHVRICVGPGSATILVYPTPKARARWVNRGRVDG